MITINGVTVPTPSDFDVSIRDICKESITASGLTVVEKIATKRELDLNWNYLSKTDLSILLNAVSSTFFTVAYPDPLTNDIRTGTFKVGERKAGAIDYINGTIRYKNISMTLAER
jgi:hypothetical protein